ncbi:MAG TPA: hypothetical protein VGM62_17245 [Chthoniobacterales bacterium]|jgi:hypothetical protein
MNRNIPDSLWPKMTDLEKDYFNEIYEDARTLEWLLEKLAPFGATREKIEESRVAEKV